MPDKKNVPVLIVEPVNEDLVCHLKKLLIQAESGELQGIVEVCTWKGDFVSHGWAITRNKMRIIGELELLKWRLLSYEEE